MDFCANDNSQVYFVHNRFPYPRTQNFFSGYRRGHSKERYAKREKVQNKKSSVGNLPLRLSIAGRREIHTQYRINYEILLHLFFKNYAIKQCYAMVKDWGIIRRIKKGIEKEGVGGEGEI